VFRLGRREIGHIHGDYQVDIPLPMEVRNQLVALKEAQPHHILPNSGWITFRFEKEKDIEHAIELFKLSYGIAKRSTEKNVGPESGSSKMNKIRWSGSKSKENESATSFSRKRSFRAMPFRSSLQA
jgi:hypothetical protein